jgi:predicted transcriptional regulator
MEKLMRGRFSTIDQEQLRHMIEVEKLTQRQAAEALGLCLSAIERACKRLSLTTQRTGPRGGDAHTNWKGGRIKVGRYWYLYEPSNPMATKRGYVAEHRKVVSDSIGRPLLPTEAVHHIDANPENNDLTNLELFQSNALHLRHELAGRVPNWTPEGLARMRAGVLKPRTRRSLKARAAKTP